MNTVKFISWLITIYIYIYNGPNLKLKSLLAKKKSSCIHEDLSFLMEVLTEWNKTALILMSPWVPMMEPKCVNLLDCTCYTCSLTVLTRRISVCTEMMALPHSPWQEGRLIKPENISYGFSNHVDLVSQSRLCFYKLISWMLRLIFHQGSIGLTVSQTMSPYMWIIHQSWPNISQWISLKDFLLFLATRMSLTNLNLYMRKRWRKVALVVIFLS